MISVNPLTLLDPSSLTSIQHAFRQEQVIVLSQAWREKAEEDFEPAWVRLGWKGDSLCIFAELKDRDIFNHATRHNDKTWLLGDAFEMFFQHANQEAYLELHVTPNNQHLRYRFSGPSMVCHPVIVDEEDFFSSRTWIQKSEDRWYVYAEIGGKSLGSPKSPLSGDRWNFSFSRYDYTRGRDAPVLSSSTRHLQADFHRVHEWDALVFTERAARDNDCGEHSIANCSSSQIC